MAFYAYEVSLQLAGAMRPVLKALRQIDPSLEKQARRAVTSIVLNVNEASARTGRDRGHLFKVAQGSAREVQAVLDVSEVLGYLPAGQLAEPRALRRVSDQLCICRRRVQS